jgi:hypothetical protein
MRTTITGLLGIALLGCGDGDGGRGGDAGAGPDGAAGADADAGSSNAPGAWRSGDRIRARVLEIEDGQRYVVGWRDAELDEPCDFLPDADGALRCLPRGEASELYEDAACEEPIDTFVATWCQSSPSRYARFRDASTCSPGFQVREVGEFLGSDEWAYHRDEGACTTIQTFAHERRYALDEEVAPEAFVAGEVVVEGDERIRARMIEGADGSRVPFGYLDQERGDPCALATAADGEVRCLPSETLEVGALYADGACEAAIAGFDPDQCAPPATVAVVEGGGTCDARRHVFPVGDVTPDAVPRVRFEDGVCQPTSTAYGLELRALGDEVPAEAFPATPREVSGDGRLRLVRHRLGANAISPSGFWDAAREAPCAFYLATDGTRRCLPIGAWQIDTYLDPACTEPIEIAQVACGEEPPTAVTVFDASCPTEATVRPLGAPIDQLDVYLAVDGYRCRPYRLDGTNYPILPEALPPEDFVAGEIVDE